MMELEDIEQLFISGKKQLQQVESLANHQIDKILKTRKSALDRAEQEMEFIVKNNIEVIKLDSNYYPQRRKECTDAPLVLYKLGNSDLHQNRVVSIVGTRKATAYGKKICNDLIENLVSHDVAVVSGMAYGIDIEAHKACVKLDIPTIGVLAHGLDRLYPAAHRDTARQMLKNGALLTEYMSQTIPDRDNFPKRNRIVAGMADATIVVESGIKGGSLITAYLAQDYNREVLAFPGRVGDPQSSGTNKLIKTSKATLIESIEDIAYVLGWDTNFRKKELNQNIELEGIEKEIYRYLQSNGAVSVDDISINCRIRVNELSVTLLTMEFNGIVQALPGKAYQLT